jgi:nicotinamidase-related amidase
MKALVVVCYQKDRVSGPMGHRFAKMIENNICERIEATLSRGGELYFLMDVFEDDYERSAEAIRNPVRHCIRGTDGASLYGKLNDYQSRAYIIRKDTPGCVDLIDSLKRYDEIELCGVDTNTDILSNAIMARTASPFAKVIVRQNCVAAKDSLLAEEATDLMTALGITVM